MQYGASYEGEEAGVMGLYGLKIGTRAIRNKERKTMS